MGERSSVKCLGLIAGNSFPPQPLPLLPHPRRSPTLSLACSISAWKRKGNGCSAGYSGTRDTTVKICHIYANYCKTIPKKIIYIQHYVPKSVRHFSLFLFHDLRSDFKNSCLVFHWSFSKTDQSTQPTASCFHQFSCVWKPQ